MHVRSPEEGQIKKPSSCDARNLWGKLLPGLNFCWRATCAHVNMCMVPLPGRTATILQHLKLSRHLKSYLFVSIHRILCEGVWACNTSQSASLSVLLNYCTDINIDPSAGVAFSVRGVML
jgi:hypothetical protein